MNYIKIEKRSLCDTTSCLRTATKIQLLCKEIDVDAVKQILKSINELDSYFLGTNADSYKFEYLFFKGKSFCLIYTIGNTERCIYVTENGYIVIKPANGFEFVFYRDGVLRLESKLCPGHNRKMKSSVNISDYLEVIVK